MARTWMTVKVELLGGHGDEFWPPPGRVFAVGPTHTFDQLGRAIDLAFARWDLAHLRMFTLADGTVVSDEETLDELEVSPDGSMAGNGVELGTRVADLVGPGAEFRYVFDFGDDWTHCCTVEETGVRPGELLGATPREPTACWGWGSMPDQYGRRWADDDGESQPPGRPAGRHPMLDFGWPAAGADRPVDLGELRGAVRRGDVDAIRAAVQGRNVDDVLQLLGEGVQRLLAEDREAAQSLALSTYNRLRERDAEGDAVLAEDLLALMKGEPVDGRLVPADLEGVADELHGNELEEAGCLDLQTGEVVPGFLSDPAMVGEDEDVDFEQEPDRWLWLERLGSREGWRDMAAFAGRVRDPRTPRASGDRDRGSRRLPAVP